MGHRVGVSIPDIRLARSVDLLNAADVMTPERTGGTPDPANRRQPLLQLSEEGPDTGRSLSVTVRREVLRLAHAQFLAGSPDALRDLYRALAELKDALAAGTAEIAVESWLYDNRSAIGSGASATLALGMKSVRTDVVQAKPLAGTDLAKMIGALGGSFKDFEALCATLAGGSGPLAVLYKAPSSTFDTLASMVRVRLSLGRPAAMRADAGWADGAFIPLAAGRPAASADLAQTAKVDLATYLTDPESWLAKSVAWIESADRLADQKGMGPGALKFLVPKGETAPVDRVADIFYMPHAFELPEAHPWLGDRRATADFLAFLLQLAQDVLAGRSIADRVHLLDTLTAAEAAANRRAVRAVLDGQPDGAVARMMRLFRRVDVAPAGPGGTAPEQLHWHAGEALSSLDALGDASPHAVVRRKLLQEPSLFSTLRAIGIGAFNRKLPRAPDPAPDVNHSTFTSELIELGLTKHLIDDREVVKGHADRFPASDLQGGMLGLDPAYYLVDLLPDHVYDDLVEIKPNTYHGVDPLNDAFFGLARSVADITALGDAAAVRGEAVLYSPRGAQPTFAANIVHVFPDWRVKEDRPPSAPRLRTYCLLPERVPPPIARSVDALQQGAVCDRTEISLDFTGTSGPRPAISPNAKWPVQYAAEVLPRLGSVTVTPADGPPKAYQRILKAGSSTGPARYLPAGVAAAGPGTAGWHLLPTYLSHFWFELDLQKPDESWSANLEDDTYEVEVELWPGTPPAAPDTTLESSPQEDPLLSAFRASRKSAQTAAAPDITRAKLEQGLQAWLQTGREGRTLLEPAALVNENALRAAATLRSFRVTRPVGDGAWSLTETTVAAPADGIGAVVAFEVLAKTDPAAAKGPKYDDASPAALASVLIRITVLDTPAFVSRARLRVARNWRDVGNDGIPDFTREFFLAERYSAWKSEGRAPVVIDDEDFNRGNVPAEGREIRATDPTALAQWLGAIDDLDKTVDHGAALPTVLASPVFRNSDTGRDETLWEGWMQDAGFTVDGLIVRAAPDPAFLFGKGDAPLVIGTRDLALAGDPIREASADHLAELLRTVRPSRVKSGRPLVLLVWRDAERMPVLRLALPLNLKP